MAKTEAGKRYRISQARDGFHEAFVFTYPGIFTAGAVEKNLVTGRWSAEVKVRAFRRGVRLEDCYERLPGDYRTRGEAAEAVIEAYEARQ